MIDTCTKHNITFMSFSPLCGPCEYQPEDSLISGELVSSIGKLYNKTGSQVALRFIVQQALEPGNSMGAVIPKSNNIDHIKSNMELFDFDLSMSDMKKLHNATRPGAETGDCDAASREPID